MNEEILMKALESKDWQTLARAFAEGDIQWHAKEWKQFYDHAFIAGRKAAVKVFVERAKFDIASDIVEAALEADTSEKIFKNITPEIAKAHGISVAEPD